MMWSAHRCVGRHRKDSPSPSPATLSLLLSPPTTVQPKGLQLHPCFKKGEEEIFREHLINDLITAQAKIESFVVAAAAANPAWWIFATEMSGKFASRMREIPNLSQRWDKHRSTRVCRLALTLPNASSLLPVPGTARSSWGHGQALLGQFNTPRVWDKLPKCCQGSGLVWAQPSSPSWNILLLLDARHNLISFIIIPTSSKNEVH